MPDPKTPGEMNGRWKRFIGALRSVLAASPEHRHEDQFLSLKEAALRLAEGQQMGTEVEKGFLDAVQTDNKERTLSAEAVEIVAMELEAFPLAVQVQEGEEKAGSAKPGARKRLRAAAKAILGSVKELFKLSEYGKAVIEVLKEAIELVGGD